MRLSCGDHSFPVLPHEQTVELVQMLGFEAFDLAVMGNRSHVRPEAIREDIPGWAGRLEERIRGRGLDIADVFCIPWTDFATMAPNNPDAAERERGTALFRDMLELTVRLGAPGLTMVPGIDWPHENHDSSLERAARGARQARRGVPRRRRPLLDRAARRLGLRHARGRRPARRARARARADARLHALRLAGVREASSSRSSAMPATCTPAVAPRAGCSAPSRTARSTTGVLVDALRASGYDGALALEYVWIDWERCNECDNVSETLLLRDRLRAAIAGEPWSYPVSST